MNPGAKKWSCEYCTYENFALSIKCSMCRGPKQLLNEDIFNLSPSSVSVSSLVESPPSPQLRIGKSPDEQEGSKWSCKQCTYLNWARAEQCIQCHLKKEELPIQTDGLVEDLKSLSVRGMSDPDLSALGKKSKTNSPLASSSNLASSKSDLNDGAKLCSSESSRKTDLKWQCFTCTYENYPKSIRCCMCGDSKDSTNKIITNEADYISPMNSNNQIENLEDMISGASNFNLITASPSSSMNAKNNLKNLPNNQYETASRYQLSSNELDSHQERRIRQLRRQADWTWLNACIGVVENNSVAVDNFLVRGGNVTRGLTSNEVLLLNRSSAFDVGHTLVHLAIRFHRDELLARLLARNSAPSGINGIKCVPSYVAPELASDIRRHFAATLRIRKAPFNCHYVTEHATFALPADIEELPLTVQEQLFDELLDRDAQKQLENPPPTLNWSLEITSRLGSRLMVLWNRSAGDCLLDSCMQATWGVFDRDNLLRRALSDSLHQCGNLFYPRWKEYEMIQAALLHFTLEEAQWEEDWSTLLSLASQQGASLEQLHIFVLAHILRRPIIVYGVKNVKSFRGEDIGYARFEGVYLPLLWDKNFCISSPISLGYTRGHFSALVPTEPYSRIDGGRDNEEDVTFLPLMDCEMKLIPIHFLTQSEMGHEENIMRQWLDVCLTEGGLLVAQQKLHKRPLLVAQMLEEWLNHYRRIAQVVVSAPIARRPGVGYLSDGDTDEE